MNKGKESCKAGGGKAKGVIRIEVKGASEAGWQIPLKQISGAEIKRQISGSLVTNILCMKSPERGVELRLTRFVHAPVERLGFRIA